MRLALSSAAAPGLAPGELLDACVRRGISAVEAAVGDGPAALRALGAEAAGRGVEVAALRAATGEEAASPEAARLSAVLGAPVVAPPASLAPERVAEVARGYAEAGGVLLLAHGTSPAEAEPLLRALEGFPTALLGLAWEVRPGAEELSAARAVLNAAGPRLRLVRLYGGGPESAGQGGEGVGALMARLALARYAGPLVLTPSTPRYHRAWSAWLGRGGGWGCGSKGADASLVVLENVNP